MESDLSKSQLLSPSAGASSLARAPCGAPEPPARRLTPGEARAFQHLARQGFVHRRLLEKLPDGRRRLARTPVARIPLAESGAGWAGLCEGKGGRATSKGGRATSKGTGISGLLRCTNFTYVVAQAGPRVPTSRAPTVGFGLAAG